MKNVAIIGSTGMIGQPVTRAFMNAGYTLTLLARDTGAARQHFGSAVRIMHGNLQDVDSLNQLLQGQDGLILPVCIP